MSIIYKFSPEESYIFYSLNLVLEFTNFVSIQRNFMDELGVVLLFHSDDITMICLHGSFLCYSRWPLIG